MGMEIQGSRSGYSAAQLELIDSLQPLLEKHCPTSLVRELIEDETATTGALWAQLAENGWTSLLYPETVGGQGLGLAEMSAVLASAGRALLPGPFFTSAVLTPLALMASGARSPTDIEGIEDVTSGKRIASLALFEGPFLFPTLVTEAIVQNDRISGVKHFVLDAQQADFFLVLAKDAGGDLVLAWVSARSTAVTTIVHPTLDGRRICTLTLENAPVSKTLRISKQSLQMLMLQASTLTASLQIGGAESALGLAIEYAQTRVQFGRPIGSFQAISHRLVDLYCNLTIGRALVQKAVRLANDDLFPEAASRAKIWMNDTYRSITKGALQTFGGIGFTFDHDIHLFLRSAQVLAADFGGSADHYRLLRTAAQAI